MFGIRADHEHTDGVPYQPQAESNDMTNRPTVGWKLKNSRGSLATNSLVHLTKPEGSSCVLLPCSSYQYHIIHFGQYTHSIYAQKH